MSAVVDLILGLFVLFIVASILYPFVLIIFLVNRKVTNLLLPKRLGDQENVRTEELSTTFPRRLK